MFAAVLAVPFGIRRKRAIAVVMVGLAVCLGGFLVSCGGGGSSISAPSTRTYTVTVTPTGSGTVTDATPIRVVLTVQ